MPVLPSPPCEHDPKPIYKIGGGYKPTAIYCRLCGKRLPLEAEQERDKVARRLLAQVFGSVRTDLNE